MKAKYEDIRKRIKEEPKWYDENGVPRYDPFHPDLSPNIYAEEVVLLEIKCQACGKKFLVEMNWGNVYDYIEKIPTLEEQVRKKNIHYGDPPRHECPCGDTMNCIDLRVVQFWKKDKWDWKRMPELEIPIENDER